MFVDRVSVKLKAGDGGNGAVSFRHEKFVDRGGPDGGDGGDGGDIILLASNNQNTLAAFRYQKQIVAENGQAGSMRRRHGKSGEDLIVAVPVGTVIVKDEEILADLTADGQQAIVAKGGKGGFGNAHFVSSTRQAPKVAEKGEDGEVLEAVLELKVIADVGIVGLPNAGKSTFLSVISNARPEIADYPFTTLKPNLGMSDIDGKSLLFADIPGLIEGAHAGKGLGDEFLRHVERTAVLLHLIDIYNEDITGAYKTIMAELAAYKIDLADRPQIVALTKVEGASEKQVEIALKELKKIVPRGTSTAAISSSSSDGIKALLRVIAKLVDKTHKQSQTAPKKPRLPVIGLREDDDSWQVQKTKNGFVVTGRKIERFARRTHFGDGPSEQRLRDIMRKMGIVRELTRQDLETGQKITIGQPAIGSIEY